MLYPKYQIFTVDTPDAEASKEYIKHYGAPPSEIFINEFGYKAAGPIGGSAIEPQQLTLQEVER